MRELLSPIDEQNPCLDDTRSLHFHFWIKDQHRVSLNLSTCVQSGEKLDHREGKPHICLRIKAHNALKCGRKIQN